MTNKKITEKEADEMSKQLISAIIFIATKKAEHELKTNLDITNNFDIISNAINDCTHTLTEELSKNAKKLKDKNLTPEQICIIFSDTCNKLADILKNSIIKIYKQKYQK